MPFSENIREEIKSYVASHTGSDSFYDEYFWFIADDDLRNRLKDEFKSVRYIYKFLEGVQATDWLLAAQVRIQILLYASIYEAVLHHVLIESYFDAQQVKEITTYKRHTRIDVKADIEKKLIDKYGHDGDVVVYVVKLAEVDHRKITFEAKAAAASKLGLISEKIRDVITKIYSLRNAIHLHAELKRDIQYEIEQSKEAYWHLQGFCQGIADNMVRDGKIAARKTT